MCCVRLSPHGLVRTCLSQRTCVHLPVLPSLLLTSKPVGAHMSVELLKEENLSAYSFVPYVWSHATSDMYRLFSRLCSVALFAWEAYQMWVIAMGLLKAVLCMTQWVSSVWRSAFFYLAERHMHVCSRCCPMAAHKPIARPCYSTLQISIKRHFVSSIAQP